MGEFTHNMDEVRAYLGIAPGSTIDWRLLEGRGFSKADIAKAVAYVNNMPDNGKDPNKIPTIWPRPDAMPTIANVDFGSVTQPKVTIANLMASNKNLKRDRLLWHVQNPGKRVHNNDFTQLPLTLTFKEGTVIVDGHHFLAALQILGQPTQQVNNLPTI